MRVDQFLDTVYLGDRACKSITVDGWGGRVSLVIDEISRVRSASGRWEFYNDENIADGSLVFSGVQSFSLTPPGPLPSDYIDIESVELVHENKDLFRVKFSVGGTHPLLGTMQMQVIELVANRVHIEDPLRPGVEITD
jgi:hypothetical protein